MLFNEFCYFNNDYLGVLPSHLQEKMENQALRLGFLSKMLSVIAGGLCPEVIFSRQNYISVNVEKKIF